MLRLLLNEMKFATAAVDEMHGDNTGACIMEWAQLRYTQ
jgi:hypothetical protein